MTDRTYRLLPVIAMSLPPETDTVLIFPMCTENKSSVSVICFAIKTIIHGAPQLISSVTGPGGAESNG